MMKPASARPPRWRSKSMGHEPFEATQRVRALKAIEEESCDVCFLDLKLGNDDGLECWLEKLQKASPALHVVMFTAYATIATAVEAMRRGAFDFIPKPFTPDQIRGRSWTRSTAPAGPGEPRCTSWRAQLASESPPSRVHSANPRCRRRSRLPSRRRRPRRTILILGPSGTGKSVLAREVHKRSGSATELSSRSTVPACPGNCWRVSSSVT
jgi:NtrC-family two-component system response regulator AlgB